MARPKLTRRRGIQIWIPVARGPGFDDTRNWAKQLPRAVGAAVPELVSWEWNVRDRGGKARLDYTQNVVNKTLVAPYSPRAAAGTPVSAPIQWDELDDPSVHTYIENEVMYPEVCALLPDLKDDVLESLKNITWPASFAWS